MDGGLEAGGGAARGKEDIHDVSFDSLVAKRSATSRFSSSAGAGSGKAGENGREDGGLEGEATSGAVVAPCAFFCCRFLSIALALAALAARSSSDIVSTVDSKRYLVIEPVVKALGES